MLVDLISTTTQDGVRLDGMFQESSASETEGRLPLDAACFIHGTGGNFYGSSLFDVLAERFLAKGCNVLRVNTRGHDGISTAVTARGGVRLGAAYEMVDDCRHDIAAWLGWLKNLNCTRVALVGHSLGAVKSIYALANDPDLPATCLVAISPPRLSYSWFCQSPQAQTFLETYQKAERLVADGQATSLLNVTLPLPFAITAAGYVEKYGPDERYNFLNFVAGVKCPLLVTFGGIEASNNMAFQGSAQALQELSRRPKRMTVETIPDGDHFYSGVREQLSKSLLTWVHNNLR